MFTSIRLRFLIAILYLLFISILFFLPGAAFPQSKWMADIWFDKWMHVGFFAMLLLLWCWANGSARHVRLWLWLAAVYGIVVELIQHYFVVNRGFDLGDWIADIAGTLAGYFFWKRYVKK